MNPIVYTAASKSYKYQRQDIKCFTGNSIFTREVMEAKRYKILGHLFFPDNDILIWTDANITLNIPASKAIKKYLGENDLMVFKHPQRQCLFDEIEVLKKDQRFSDPFLQDQLRQQEYAYKMAGMPKRFGLWECNFIIRRNIPSVNALFESWWAEICRWQWRDQVSFPYCLRRFKDHVRIRVWGGGDIRENADFTYKNHYR